MCRWRKRTAPQLIKFLNFNHETLSKRGKIGISHLDIIKAFRGFSQDNPVKINPQYIAWRYGHIGTLNRGMGHGQGGGPHGGPHTLGPQGFMNPGHAGTLGRPPKPQNSGYILVSRHAAIWQILFLATCMFEVFFYQKLKNVLFRYCF